MGQGLTTPALHHAIQSGNTRHLQHILKKSPGININEKYERKTALYLAIIEQDDEVIDLLLEHGADPNIICMVDKNSWAFPWSALHEACWQGMSRVLERLIARGGDVNLQAHQDMTPLHVAAWFGNKDIMRKLLVSGCDVNHLDRFKESALVMPICQGDYESVRLLLMSGCKLDSRSWANIRKIQCKYDLKFQQQMYTRPGPFTLFTLAIKYTWLDIAILLLQHGFDPNRYSITDVLEDIKTNVGGINEDSHKLIHCFLAAGYKFRASDERELSYLETLCTLGNPEPSPDHRSHDERPSGTSEPNHTATVGRALLEESSSHESLTASAETLPSHGSCSPSSSSVESQAGKVITVTSIEPDTNELTDIPPETAESKLTIPRNVFNPDPRIQSLASAVNKDFLDWLLSHEGIRGPLSLKQACHRKIRSHLRHCRSQASVLPSIQNLNLPQVLKDYLMLSEFGDPLREEMDAGPTTQTYLDTEKLYFAMSRRQKQQQGQVFFHFCTSCCGT